MTSLLMAALLVSSADTDPNTDPAVKAPTGTAPTMMVLQAKEKGLVRQEIVRVSKAVPVKEKVTVAGKEVERTVYKTVIEEKNVSTTYPIDGATFQTAGGKKLEKAEALKKMATPTLVVVSGDGRPVDEGFLAALKPGTLVVVMPMPAGAPGVRPGRPAIRPLPPIRIRPGKINIAPIAPPAVPPAPPAPKADR